MGLGGVLFFNKHHAHYESKTQVRGRGNQHDEDNDVDLKISDEYIKNGMDNFFPFDIENVTKKSMLQTRAFRTITNIIDGKLLFQNPDGSAVDMDRQQELIGKYESIGISKRKFQGPTVKTNYLQGGSFVTLQWASDGFGFALANVAHRVYKTGRLSAPIWYKTEYVFPKHFYHRNWGYHYNKRNKRVTARQQTMSWLEWNQDPRKYRDAVCWINSYNEELDLNEDVNRLQSYLIMEKDPLSDYYPIPCWFSGTVYNYERSEFLLSCFDIDDIENGFHASGIVKVYHSSYIDPESAEAKQTFEDHRKIVETKLRGSFNSGSVAIVPTAIDPDGTLRPTNDFMEFEPFKTNSNKERHEILDKRIINKVLGANGIIMPELVGIRDEKSTLSESGAKLLNAVKLLNQFTIKPEKQKLEDFYNEVINKELGIEEKAVIAPNMQAFLNINPELIKHYLHPEQWYDMYSDFGLSRPTVEQVESDLIPAYARNNNGSMSQQNDE